MNNLFFIYSILYLPNITLVLYLKFGDSFILHQIPRIYTYFSKLSEKKKRDFKIYKEYLSWFYTYLFLVFN